MKKITLLMLMSLLLISFAFGLEGLPPQQQGNCVDLIQTCDNCTYVNLTKVLKPNGLEYINAEMTKSNGDYNYSYCNTTSLGEYIVTACGNDDGYYTCDSYPFTVTPSGTLFDSSQAIIYLVVLIMISFIFLLSAYGTYKLPWKNKRNLEGQVVGVNDLKYLKVILGFATYFLLIWIIYLLWGLTGNFLMLNTASSLFRALFYILITILFPGMVFFLFVIVVSFITDRKIKKAVMRGLPIR